MPVPRVVLWTDASASAQGNSDQHLPNESGGIAIGHVRGGTIVITRLTEPGPNAVQLPDHFLRDGEYAQAMLDATFAESGGRDDYLGEWHSHPFPQGPSAQDRESMRRISRNPDYGCPQPVLVLCRRFRRKWRLEGYRWDGEHLARMPLVVSDAEITDD